MTCATNGGNPAEGSGIDPLTNRTRSWQRRGQQPVQTGLLVGRTGVQYPIAIRQHIAIPQDVKGTVIGCQDPPAPVQVNNADSLVLEQGGHGRLKRPGAHQRLPDAHELADMGQQPRDHGGLRSLPALPGHGVAQGPCHVGAIRPVQAHDQAILVADPGEHLVVGGGGLQLLGRVQVGDVHQPTVGQLPHTRYFFVDGMVDLKVLALQIRTALPAVVEPDGEHPDSPPSALRRP